MLDPPQNAEFVRLWTLHGQRVYAYLLTLTSNRADADEIFQEVGITLWEKFDQFESGTSFQAWARRVALNKVRSFRQLRRIRRFSAALSSSTRSTRRSRAERKYSMRNIKLWPIASTSFRRVKRI